MDKNQFEARKREHIQHSLQSAHQAEGLSGLDQIHLVHEALPDLDFQNVQLESSCLGRMLATPFYVAGMTAGHPDASQINRILALACEERGWAMGVGSQRRDLEAGGSEMLDRWKELRAEVPRLSLFANIGISQLITAEVSQVRRLVRELGAQALVVHLNALQEVMQPEGTPYFQGGFLALRRYCQELGEPIVLKETGCGFSRSTLERLSNIGLAALDVSGLGGTHWGRIEGARAELDSVQSSAAMTFANWGEPTAQSVLSAAEVFSCTRTQTASSTETKSKTETETETEIWASGGVRSGLDAAKLIALGAHRVGYAKPALEAALQGPKKLRSWMETQEFELRVALFCTGTADCRTLRGRKGASHLLTPFNL